MEKRSGKVSGNKTIQSPVQVEILGTFVVEPLQQSLQYWSDHFHHNCTFLNGEYGQLFQRLLQQDTDHRNADIHALAFAVRDLVPDGQLSDLSGGSIHSNIKEFIDAVKASISGDAGSWMIVRCPDPVAGKSGLIQKYDIQAAHIAKAFNQDARINFIDASDLGSDYKVDGIFDEVSDKHGHIPYTEAYYQALGAVIYRLIRARLGTAYKLIVTDCDGTLWEGVCGETGADKLSLLPEQLWLQQFLKNKKDKGMLLAICSQNNTDDVEAVFSCRGDFALSLDDFTKTKINWSPKADNIQQLAMALNVGLESIIFLDNDPIQRNHVRMNLPQVLVPELPENIDRWPLYLRHVWAFDSLQATGESKRRHLLYRDHALREDVRSNARSFTQFLKNLGLNIKIKEAAETEMPRIFELVNRVTQFNINGAQLTESEISAMIMADNEGWLVVQVEDRFGDYGLVGAVGHKIKNGTFFINSFLLSCRSLGRGVENKMIQKVSEQARQRGFTRLNFVVCQTNRNYPGLAYLRHFGLVDSDIQAGVFAVDVSAVEENSEQVGLWQENVEPRYPDRSGDKNIHQNYMLAENPSGESESILSAAKLLSELYASSGGMHLTGESFGTVENQAAASLSDTEKRIYRIFQDVLGQQAIAADEEFFDAGGHSLLVIRLLSRIKDEFDVDLPIRLLFTEKLSVVNLASIVEDSSTPEENSAEFDSIKNALDTFSDKELESLFGDLEKTEGEAKKV